MKFIQTVCPICGKRNTYDVLFERNFRDLDLNEKVFSARRIPDKLHYRIVKCTNDSMVRSNPVLSDATLSRLYLKSRFTYEAEVKNLTATYLQVLEPVLAKLKKTDRILEIGCGNGFMLEALRKLGFTNVYGVEPSTDAIKKAPATIRKHITRGIFRKGIFPKASFSLVCMFQTLDHIPQPDRFLADCATVMKKGGYILSLHHDVESFSATMMGERSPIFDVEHTQLFSKKTSMLLFQKSGFTVESVKSPSSIISFKHLIWLLPLPGFMKEKLLKQRFWSHIHIDARLGNISILGKKS